MTQPITYTGAPFTTEPGAIIFLPEDADRGFTEDEAYAFLSGGIEAVNALIAAAGPAHTGAMIALLPSHEDLTELVIADDDDAEPLEELHITAAYLGDAEDVDTETREELITQLTDLAANQPIIVGDVIGFAVLNPDGPEPCLVANVSGPDLEDAHDSILELLDDLGVKLPFQHKPWLAHITLGYADDPRQWLTDELMEKTGLISIDRIRVAFGGVVTDIPFGHPAVVAGQAFHLPGKHDQQSHGGLRSMASSDEVRIAGKLNKGKKLDPSNPGEAQMRGAIQSWSGGSPGDASSTPKMFKEDVSHTISTDPMSTDDSGVFARTVAAAPADSPTLYRGMKNVPPEQIPQAGDTFDLGPTSFTRDRKVMDDFTTLHHPAQADGHLVRTRVRKGSRSLQIDQESGAFKHEREHVGMGRYRVTSRRDTVESRRIDGEDFDVKITDLEIEQIDMTGDVSFTRHSQQQQPSGFDPGDLN